MSTGNRIAVTLVIVLAALFGLSVCGYQRWETIEQSSTYGLMSAESQPAPMTPLCVLDDETKERLRGIMIEAIDEGLKEHIVDLYKVWMRDERGQPGRARVGIEAAVRAHQAARKGALAWDPPYCAP